MKDLIGKQVEIEWSHYTCDEAKDNWKFFQVLGFTFPFLQLKGIDDPSGGEHDGSIFYQNVYEISTVTPF